MTGNQAMQLARAGLEAIYLSGWQVAVSSDVAGAIYSGQSLYPANSRPELCWRINRTLQRAGQSEHAEGGAKSPPAPSTRCRWRSRAASPRPPP